LIFAFVVVLDCPRSIALIQQMAKENCLWGAVRIHDDLLKLGIHVAKRTIRKNIARPSRPLSSANLDDDRDKSCPGYLGERFPACR
jgi:hypothetical protein